MFILDFNCISSAGVGPATLWKSLTTGQIHSAQVGPQLGGRDVIPSGLLCAIEKGRAVHESAFDNGFQQIWRPLSHRLRHYFPHQLPRLGFIFSSTKGTIEDFIWNPKKPGERDPVTTLMDHWISEFEIPVTRSLCVSNACASSHVAFEIAELWLEENFVDAVIVIAADLVGPFIYNGFQSLRALSLTQNRPFSADRDGLQLGDAITGFLLSRQPMGSQFKIVSVFSETEGQSVTRPSSQGQSLARVGQKALREYQKNISAVIAHGTGTGLNDKSEDLALKIILNERIDEVPITCTKWSIGHTLGASGSMDLIAAIGALQHQELFKIHSTAEKDPSFSGNYLTLANDFSAAALESVLITSLGFGGVHAAMIVEKGSYD